MSHHYRLCLSCCVVFNPFLRRTRDFRRSRKKTIVKFNLILIDLKIFNGIFLRSSQQFIVKIGKKRTKTIESLFQDQDMVKKKR